MPVIQLPDRWVAGYARLATWLLGLVIAGWVVVLSLWMALHWFILPRIDEFRPWLQDRASAALGIRVELGSISAESHGWTPEFKVRDIRLLDESGVAQLELAQVTLALTPTSAVQGEFSQIALDRLDLDVVRDARGVIRVGGLTVQGASDDRLRNWIFAQWEWVLRQSRVTWTDEASGLPPAHLHDLEGVLRNSLREHRFRIDGSPDAELGERISIRGRFRQPLLSNQAGVWEDWSGQAYVASSQINLAAWARHGVATWGLPPTQGHGWMRAWLEWRAGALQQVSVDAEVKGLRTEWTTSPTHTRTLALASAQGRITWVPGPKEHWTLQHAQLSPGDLTPWKIGLAEVVIQRSADGQVLAGEGQIDRVDLSSLNAFKGWMPEEGSALWAQMEPKGALTQVKWRWQGSRENLRILNWQAQAHDLVIKAAGTTKSTPLAAWPGIRGLNAQLSGTDTQVKGAVQVTAGELDWPGLWDRPKQTIHQFKGDALVERTSEGLRVQLRQAQLLTEQARADFDLTWLNTPQDPLGQLDLNAQIPMASVSQIARWLPAALPEGVRQYVRLALPQGEARQIQARVKGHLQHFPFSQPGTGEFMIKGQLSKVRFVTVPRSLMNNKTAGEWPVFQDLSGELVFDRDSMQLSKVKARIAQAPGIAWGTLEARIRALDRAVVEVKAEGKGPLADALGFWRASPLNLMTDRVLDGTRGQGVAEYRMGLSIPVSKPEDTQAKGSVQLSGNEVLMAAGAPTLTRLRGSVLFTDAGFDLQGVQASLWGGDVRLEGGSKAQASAQAPAVQIKAQGQVSASGLRDAPELRDWASHLRKLQGSTPYTAQLQWRRGQLESQISSDLVGMAIQAPVGLGKKASEPLPLRWDSSLTAESTQPGALLQEQMWLRWGSSLDARFIRDLSTPQPKVLRGLIRWGSTTATSLPTQGVTLRVGADTFNIDEWSDWMQPFSSAPVSGADAGAWNFAPQRLEFAARQVLAQGRRLNQVQVTAQRNNETWTGQIRAQELDGELQYAPARGTETARLQARLNRLAIPASASTDAEALLDNNLQDLPTLDISVKDLDLKGKKLGSLELLAQNRTRPDGSREWRMGKLLISNEDGDFSAQGQWRKLLAQSSSQTQFDFKLSLKNVGGLLQRLGLPDAVRSGHGSIEGQVNWSGSPISPEVMSMGGQFRVAIERGQFLKTEPGAARLLGVLSLQSLPRRLMLDFRDVFSEGFAFDFFRGDVRIDQGIASSSNLQMKGVNVAVLMEGQANIGQETQDLKILVIPDINAGGASLVYSAINPLVGLTTFLAQYVLRRPLMESTTQQFHLDGTWSEPRVTQVPFRPEPKP